MSQERNPATLSGTGCLFEICGSPSSGCGEFGLITIPDILLVNTASLLEPGEKIVRKRLKPGSPRAGQISLLMLF
jgi:hypothetical protein